MATIEHGTLLDAPPERSPGAPSRPTSGPQSSSPLDEALRSMLARPQRLFWSALFSAAVAVGCAAAFSQTKYAYEGKLLYVPNSVTAPYYESPALGSLVQVVVSPKLIGQLRDELALPEDVGDLRRSIRFDVSEADTLTISTARPSESEAKDTVDRLMERFVAEARRVRDAALTQFVADFATNVATARADYDQAIESQQQFLGEHQLETPGDVLAGVTMLQQAAAELELALENARSELSAVTAKRNHMRVALQQENDRIVANKPVVYGESAEDEPPAESAVASFRLGLQDDLDRRALLRDRIQQQRELGGAATRIEVKKHELERARSLHERQLISSAELERIEGELAVLQAEHSASVLDLYNALNAIENRISRTIDSSPGLTGHDLSSRASLTASTLTPAYALSLLEIEILGIEERVKHLTEALEAKRRQAASLGMLLKDFTPYAENVRLAAEEWQRRKQLLDEFQQVARSDAGELSIVQDAELAFDGVRSNNSRIFAIAFLGTFALVMAPQLAWQWRRQARRAA